MENEKIRLATVFSGIGSIEQALIRLNIPHEIVFACDNGEREIEVNYAEEFEKVKSLSTVEEKKEYVDNIYKNKSRQTNFGQ